MNDAHLDWSDYNMKELLNQDHTSFIRRAFHSGDGIHIDVDKSGWGFFSPEISFFLVDFCKEQLSPIQKIIFYSYFVNGMTLKEISERLYGPDQEEKFISDEECDDDDRYCNDDFHSSYQAIHHHIKKIEKKLRYSWKYMDRWDDKIVTKRVKNKKIKVFNPNVKKEK